MLKSIAIAVILFLCTSPAFCQGKDYKLISKNINSDIDYTRLNDLNKSGAGYNLLNKIFTPIKGQWIVYRFLATFRGLSHETTKQQTFHDVIILKTNSSGFIVDAFQYTLEWAELPRTIDLYRSKTTTVKLIDDLPISILNFHSAEGGKYLNEAGILKLSK